MKDIPTILIALDLKPRQPPIWEEEIPTIDETYGCDPWDDDHHGKHAASREHAE